MALKPKHSNRTAARVAEFIRTLTLTRQEQGIVAALLISMLVGAMIMHWRREYGWHHPLPAGLPTPGAAARAASPAGG
jgi:hypothetical protein